MFELSGAPGRLALSAAKPNWDRHEHVGLRRFAPQPNLRPAIRVHRRTTEGSIKRSTDQHHTAWQFRDLRAVCITDQGRDIRQLVESESSLHSALPQVLVHQQNYA